MEINWGLMGQTPNIGQSFQQGMAQGRQNALQMRSDQALQAIQRNPNDTNALGTLALYNPQAANSVIQMRGIQRQEQQRQLLSGAYNPATGQIDYQAAAAKAAAGGDGATAAELAQQGRAAAVQHIEYAKKVMDSVIQDAGNVHDQASYVAWMQRAAPQVQAAGIPVPNWIPPTYSEEGMQQVRMHALGVAEQLKQLQPDQKQFGRYVFEDGKPKYLLPPDNPYVPGVPGGSMMANPAAITTDGKRIGIQVIGGEADTPEAPTPTPAAPTPPADPIGGGQYPPERAAMLRAIWGQESGNTPGVTGPATPYGHALGIGQTLPATAHAMAAKIGLPWQPELLTAKTPEAAQYQRALSAAYLDEAAHAAGGYNENAAKYYFAGPNHALWGAKTDRYGREVMARLSSDPKYAAAGQPAQAGGPEATTTVNGQSFVKVNGKWYHADVQQADAAQEGSDAGGY